MTPNHPAHGPVSLDRLHQISEILSKAAAQSDGGNLGYAMADAVKVINSAIALFSAEPVGITDRNEIECLKRGEMANVMPPDYKGVDAGDEVYVYVAPTATVEPVAFINGAWTLVYYRPPKELGLKIGDKLFTAPPAPAFVPTFDEWLHIRGNKPLGWVKDAMRESYDACRSAMIQAGNSPSKCSLREGVEAIRKSGIPVDVDKIQSECDAVNSPVIPDGWIPVSERVPEESGRYWCYVEEQNSLGKSHYQWNCSWNGEVWSDKALSGRVTHWMPLPAAPQQEVTGE